VGQLGFDTRRKESRIEKLGTEREREREKEKKKKKKKKKKVSER